MAIRPTIFALSSGPPPAAIAVIRLSGSQAGVALRQLTELELPPARRAVLRNLVDPRSQLMLDQALVLWLPGPDTVTGEDLVELHVHGGRAIVNAVLETLGAMDGLKPAEAGAFTRRAFENGRLDLSQAEGLADLLAAETESQRRNALAMSEGGLTSRAAGWRRDILNLAAQTEALLDFGDEDDVAPEIDAKRLNALIEDLGGGVNAPSAERLRDGIRVVIAGPPNAGKSTLLNVLAGRSVAITAEIAGTTRDIVEAPVAIDGVPFVLTDTAGLHDATSDQIELEGIRRARSAMETSDILLWLGNPDDCPDRSRAIMIAARADEYADTSNIGDLDLLVSARTGLGIAELRKRLLDEAKRLLPIGDTIAINRRQRGLVTMIRDELIRARGTPDLLIVAEHLRLARGAIDRLVGRAGVEDMLDTLFGGMCIGK